MKKIPITYDPILLLVFGFLILIWRSQSSDERHRAVLLTALTGGFYFVFSLALVLVYVYHFPGIQGLRIDSFERYMGVFFAGFGLVILGKLVQVDNRGMLIAFGLLLGSYGIKEAPPINNIINISPLNSIFGINPINEKKINVRFLISAIDGLRLPLVFFDYLRTPAQSNLTFRSDLSEKISGFGQQIEPGKKLWFIHQHDSGLPHRVAAFDLFPTKVNGWCWSIGTPFGPNDYWTCPLTDIEWSELLAKEEWHYVFLYKINADFIKDFGSLFDEELTEDSTGLFAVSSSWDTRKVAIARVNPEGNITKHAF